MPKTSSRASQQKQKPKKKQSLKPFVVAGVAAGAALFGLRLSEPTAVQRSPQAQQAEQETRDLVDQRTALHLQKLRAL